MRACVRACESMHACARARVLSDCHRNEAALAARTHAFSHGQAPRTSREGTRGASSASARAPPTVGSCASISRSTSGPHFPGTGANGLPPAPANPIPVTYTRAQTRRRHIARPRPALRSRGTHTAPVQDLPINPQHMRARHSATEPNTACGAHGLTHPAPTPTLASACHCSTGMRLRGGRRHRSPPSAVWPPPPRCRSRHRHEGARCRAVSAPRARRPGRRCACPPATARPRQATQRATAVPPPRPASDEAPHGGLRARAGCTAPRPTAPRRPRESPPPCRASARATSAAAGGALVLWYPQVPTAVETRIWPCRVCAWSSSCCAGHQRAGRLCPRARARLQVYGVRVLGVHLLWKLHSAHLRALTRRRFVCRLAVPQAAGAGRCRTGDWVRSARCCLPHHHLEHAAGGSAHAPCVCGVECPHLPAPAGQCHASRAMTANVCAQCTSVPPRLLPALLPAPMPLGQGCSPALFPGGSAAGTRRRQVPNTRVTVEGRGGPRAGGYLHSALHGTDGVGPASAVGRE
jgi:hypothetical protein